ncbi:MAG: nucleotidyltransferase family protein [Bacteroidetes bacterium]|nr:nucleotidyltransferase family protein [Bacteroidota bacterium]
MLSVILLAAGSSRRMGNANKLLLPWQGKPLVTITAERLLAAGFEEVILVTGHQAEAIAAAVGHLPVKLIHNPLFGEGMTSSIQAGVGAASGSGYLIGLADMVRITTEEYRLLKAAWEAQYEKDDRCIGLPEYQGQKGNPVIFPRSLRDDILRHPEKEGCKAIVQRNPAHQFNISMPTDHILRDIDLPEDYSLLSKEI